MKSTLHTFSLLMLLGFFLPALPGHADTQYSPERLEVLDQWGFFPPGFKTDMHELVDTKQALAQTKQEEKNLEQQVPDLQKQAADVEAKVADLRKELAEYEHSDETDFIVLQKKMGDSQATQQEQLALAQAYVWTYSASPHAVEAKQYLQDIQKKQANQTQAEKDDAAARAAAHAKLVQRALAKDLSLNEWRDFLHDMSQEELVKYLGRPQLQTTDYWTYTGDWTEDPMTHQKVGLQINFNAARVDSVSPAAR